MLKKLISLLLLLFLSQSVLASFDLHHSLDPHKTDNNKTTDIIKHYNDSYDAESSFVHICQNGPNQIQFQNQSDDGSNNFHHHECHGHTSSITFSSFPLDNVQYEPVYIRFAYLLNDYFISLSSLQRPPIK